VTAPLLAFDAVPLGTSRTIPVTLAVAPHRAVAVVGEVASGVDRLAPWALGLARPPAGRALLLGEDAGTMSRHAVLAFRRRVGYVPEGDGLLQNLSLADNIALPLRFGSGMTPQGIHGRLRVILGAFRLADVARLRPAEADDEQRRRAAFARALVFDPPIVLLQQPFDGIGTSAAGELLSLARGGETAEGPRRSIFVTSQTLPDSLRSRFDEYYRVTRHDLRRES
jgi:phospholipid/cholesterol/gamma-HCH transport system ATP-binding protein